MLPLRSLSMTIVGVLAIFLGISAWLSPAEVQAQYGSGWLFLNFGLSGVVGTLLLIGAVFLVWGVAGVVRFFRQARPSRSDPTQ